MARHACINGTVVVSVVDVQNEHDLRDLFGKHSTVVNIDGLLPEPQIGWVLSGVTLVPGNGDSLNQDLVLQNSQRLYGLTILPNIIDKVGARNLQLVREGTQVNIASLAAQMASVKLLLETGALRTAQALCQSLLGSFPLHADIIEEAIAKIEEFFQE